MESTTNKIADTVTRPTLTVDFLDELIRDKLDNSAGSANPRQLRWLRETFRFLFSIIWQPPYDSRTGANDKDDHLGLEDCFKLVAYTFFVSHNAEFHYNWSYLLDKIGEFSDFLLRFKQHIQFVIDDINRLVGELAASEAKMVEFSIDNYLKIRYLPKKNRFDASIELHSLGRILKVSKDSYRMIISVDAVEVAAQNRKLRDQDSYKTLVNLMNNAMPPQAQL